MIIIFILRVNIVVLRYVKLCSQDDVRYQENNQWNKANQQGHGHHNFPSSHTGSDWQWTRGGSGRIYAIHNSPSTQGHRD